MFYGFKDNSYDHDDEDTNFIPRLAEKALVPKLTGYCLLVFYMTVIYDVCVDEMHVYLVIVQGDRYLYCAVLIQIHCNFVGYLGIWGYIYTTCYCKWNHISNAIKWGELGRRCKLGQNFSESSPLLLLIKGHWCEMGQTFSALLIKGHWCEMEQTFSALSSLRLLVNAYLTTIAKVTIH